MRVTRVPVATLAFVSLAVVATPQAPPDDGARNQAQRLVRSGEELMSSESWEQAAAEFRAAVALDPSLVLAHYNLGRCLMGQRLYPEAQAAYEASVETLRRRSLLSETERLQMLRDIDDEIHELRALIRRFLSDAKTIDKEKRVMEFEERIRVLEQSRPTEAAAARIPPELHLALGSALMRQNKLAEAESEYLAAVSLDKKLGAAHNNLAVIYMLTGRFDEARKALKQAEKAGFPVPGALKADIDKREAAAKAGAPAQ